MAEIEELPSEFYKRGESDRTQYEDRAKLISKLTLPYVMREDTDTGTTSMVDGNNQSYGGKLVNTLKAKMGMALLPPSTSSFRYSPKSEELQALTGGNDSNRAKVFQQLSSQITAVNNEIEIQQIRSSLFDMLLQLIVVGSVIVEKKKKKGMLIHTLQSFVVDLDNQGNPIQMCIVEMLKVLPQGIVPKVEKDEYELFTMATMEKETGRWTVIQEIEGEIVGTEANYKDYDTLPFRYLGWTWMKGDSYHRPYAEDYFKDLEQLDKLMKLLIDGSIISAKTILFVNQRGGRTTKESVADSSNGDVIDGSADDVTTLKTEKNFDYQTAQQEKQELKKDLASAFLMNESVTRDAERVTAQEIQFMAQELEQSSLSGIYSKMSLQFSKWNVEQVMIELGIKFDAITVDIITGLDALGRSQEAQKLDRLLQRAEALGVRRRFKDQELIDRYAAMEGVDTTGLIMTDEEYKQMLAEEKQAMTSQQGDEALAQGAGKAAGENVANAAIPPQQ